MAVEVTVSCENGCGRPAKRRFCSRQCWANYARRTARRGPWPLWTECACGRWFKQVGAQKFCRNRDCQAGRNLERILAANDAPRELRDSIKASQDARELVWLIETQDLEIEPIRGLRLDRAVHPDSRNPVRLGEVIAAGYPGNAERVRAGIDQGWADWIDEMIEVLDAT